MGKSHWPIDEVKYLKFRKQVNQITEDNLPNHMTVDPNRGDRINHNR